MARRRGAPAPAKAMESHQQALVDQSIRYALTRYDDGTCLLRSSDDPRFRVVLESLAFAALLLFRSAAGRGRRTELGLARLLIDTILPLQNTRRRDPAAGSFPMLWIPDSRRSPITDPDSREIFASLLGVLAKDYVTLLGEKRTARVTAAVRLAMRADAAEKSENISAAMIAAWLEMEFGDRWKGERIATDVALAGYDHLAASRFGDARAFARELWALSLWRRSAHLHDGAAPLVTSVLGDIQRFAHPSLPEVFGSVTTSATSSNSAYPWLGTWLTWHALGREPMLPKTMLDPLHATLFAFPAIARLKFEAGEVDARACRGGEALKLALEHCHRRGSVTGWWEQDLHLEARRSDQVVENRMPVAGARWRTRNGSSVWLRCRVAGRQDAVVRKRFVHLENPGTTLVSVHNMGEGEARMIDNGWWLSGLHFATEGFQMADAQRTEKGLELKFHPTADQAMLLFSPLK
jgi:hypothetical protein